MLRRWFLLRRPRLRSQECRHLRLRSRLRSGSTRPGRARGRAGSHRWRSAPAWRHPRTRVPSRRRRRTIRRLRSERSRPHRRRGRTSVRSSWRCAWACAACASRDVRACPGCACARPTRPSRAARTSRSCRRSAIPRMRPRRPGSRAGLAARRGGSPVTARAGAGGAGDGGGWATGLRGRKAASRVHRRFPRAGRARPRRLDEERRNANNCSVRSAL